MTVSHRVIAADEGGKPTKGSALSQLKSWRFWLVRMFSCPIPCLSQSVYFIGGKTVIELLSLLALLGCAIYFPMSASGTTAGSMADFIGLVMIVLATRNNVMTYLLGVSFERALYWHKAVAFATVAAMVIHLNAVGSNGTGLGLIVMFCLTIALYLVKPYMFEVFYYLHVLIYVGIFVLCLMHGSKLIPLGGAVWSVDLIVRYVLNRKAIEVEALLLHGDVIKLQFDKTFHYEAGQYCFLRIGDIANLEFHPFSLSSSPLQDKTSFHIRALGDWTRRLQQKIKDTGTASRDTESGAIVASVRSMPLKVVIEGPFGVPMVNFNDHSYQVILLISGGIGITPLQSVFNHILMEESSGRREGLRKVIFVWSVKDKAMLDTIDRDSLLTPEQKSNRGQLPISFQPAMSISIDTASKRVRRLSVPKSASRDDEIDVVRSGSSSQSIILTTPAVKRSPVHRVPSADEEADDVRNATKQRSASEPSSEPINDKDDKSVGIDSTLLYHTEFYLTSVRSADAMPAANIFPEQQSYVKFGRPNLPLLFEQTHGLCVKEGISKVGVFVCGPPQMVSEASDLSVHYSKNRVGFHCHSEVFDF